MLAFMLPLALQHSPATHTHTTLLRTKIRPKLHTSARLLPLLLSLLLFLPFGCLRFCFARRIMRIQLHSSVLTYLRRSLFSRGVQYTQHFLLRTQQGARLEFFTPVCSVATSIVWRPTAFVCAYFIHLRPLYLYFSTYSP